MRWLVLVGATAFAVLSAVPAADAARPDTNRPSRRGSGKPELEKKLDLSRYRAGFHYVIDASSAGSLLAVSYYDTVKMWSLGALAELPKLKEDDDNDFEQIGVSADGKTIVSRREMEKRAELWSVSDRKPVRQFSRGDYRIYDDLSVSCIALDKDGAMVAVAVSYPKNPKEPFSARAGWIDVYSTRTGLWKQRVGSKLPEVQALGFASDGRSLVVATGPDSMGTSWEYLTIVDLTTDKMIKAIPLDTSVRSLVVSPDGQNAAVVASKGDRVTIVNLGQEKVVASVPGRCASFSADGRRLVTGAADHAIRIWNLQSDPSFSKPLSVQTPGSVEFVKCVTGGSRLVGLVTSSSGHGPVDYAVLVWRLPHLQ